MPFNASQHMFSPRRMKPVYRLLCLAGLMIQWTCTPALARETGEEWMTRHEGVLRQTLGVPRGIVIVLGEDGPRLALALARRTECRVYQQTATAEAVAAVREAVAEAGLYGKRIFVGEGPPTRLHLADSIADALICRSSRELDRTEVLRVLRPQGRAWLGEEVITKPIPDGIDEWSHPYHLPDNNPLSDDRVIRGPYLTQFLADPRYAPLPQVAVASGGRVFKAFGHIAFKPREEPLLNTLAAYNGYNGTLLWQRQIAPAIMVHRNTLIATPTEVYFGDDKSCKVLDAATGELRREIVPPEGLAGGTFWKWMALERGTLYALMGEQEQRDPVIKLKWERHGWPWNPLSPGFNQPEHKWGFGRTLLAIDPVTSKVHWRYSEDEPMDSRALCMKDGRLYTFRFGAYLTCLDVETGKVIWRRTKASDPALFEAMGAYLDRQDWRTNWRTTAYLKCGDEALYFAGPSFSKLLAVSTSEGRALWEHPYSNYQLVIRKDGLYGISGQIDEEVSRKFHPLTGEILSEMQLGRRACTRPTACPDAIFFRASEGSVRLDVSEDRAELVSPMRAQCHDGVTIANGLLYWWPSTCDCNLTLYGMTSLTSAGDYDFNLKAETSERLRGPMVGAPPEEGYEPDEADWPTFRANNRADVTTLAALPADARRLWEVLPGTQRRPTPPTAVGDLVFLSGDDGIVHAINARTGKTEWRFLTGGAVNYPPTVWGGMAYIGSGDGWVYCLNAADGSPRWKFRAAPIERRIPVYGGLMSTWPVASGVLVQDGVAYFAAGIVNYDGTHVYALDATTGSLKWQNSGSGHLDAAARTGVSVQGHLAYLDGRLYLAGGNAVSPARYDGASGECLNDPAILRRTVNNNVPAAVSPRGSELYLLAGRVFVAGKPLYSHPDYPVYDASVLNKLLVSSVGRRDVAWASNQELACYDSFGKEDEAMLLEAWSKGELPKAAAKWRQDCPESRAIAIAGNAVAVADAEWIYALSLEEGSELWRHPLPAAVVPWGLALNRQGTVIVSLVDGRVLAFAGSPRLASLSTR